MKEIKPTEQNRTTEVDFLLLLLLIIATFKLDYTHTQINSKQRNIHNSFFHRFFVFVVVVVVIVVVAAAAGAAGANKYRLEAAATNSYIIPRV